ncbi:MAG TPA: ribosome silencing factor [Phaeodactylibacter sp.]|nr:ribosome silencing factor [Phaeodactylibacter sp.]
MNSPQTQQKELTGEALNALIIDSIQDIKGEKIVVLDLRHLDDAPTDYFIICEGNSNTQVKAISDNVYIRVKKEGFSIPSNYEGQGNSLWILLDYFSTVVHVFYKETRAFYQLEELWGDAIFTEYDNI